jgi:hypothetical protein
MLAQLLRDRAGFLSNFAGEQELVVMSLLPVEKPVWRAFSAGHR